MGLYGRQMNNITGTLFQNRQIFFPWKYVRSDDLKTESVKICILIFDAFHVILKFFSLGSKRHTSGLKNPLPVTKTNFLYQRFQCQKIFSPKEEINNWIWFIIKNKNFVFLPSMGYHCAFVKNPKISLLIFFDQKS